ncbi:hypothetical protein B0I35DRAFT_91571 [Stachybotrys elegans]|uniref:Uncharacterized protein n=1 Tax=Stachybotrys elegans TaxID=80388 RepID=A0A8K0SMT7_9HYPO|nr:hypothetical protein B0I35DRAFT_91571 [Stachybotrys elegans]
MDMVDHLTKNCVSTDTCIAAKYLNIEGHYYLQGLRNFDDASCVEDGFQSIFDPKSPSDAARDCIYVARDHLGVRDIRFLTRDQAPTGCSRPGTYWQALAFDAGEADIEYIFDGLKARNMHVRDKTCGCLRSLPPELEVPHAFNNPPRILRYNNKPLGRRMKALKLNDPSVRAYFFCWNEGLVGFHIQRTGEGAPVSWYDAHQPRGAERHLWQYVPINPNDPFTEIWHLSYEGTQCFHLTLVTLHGRKITIGPHHCPDTRPLRWHLVDAMEPGEQRDIHVGLRAQDIADIGFDGPIPSSTGRRVPELPFLPHQEDLLRAFFWYSEADLAGVVFFRLSFIHDHNPQENPLQPFVVGGLLLMYGNGDVVTVGEVRIDTLSPRYYVVDGAIIAFIFAQGVGGGHVVIDAVVHPEGYNYPLQATELYRRHFRAGSGQLQWWSSPHHTVLGAGELASPRLPILDLTMPSRQRQATRASERAPAWRQQSARGVPAPPPSLAAAASRRRRF